MTTDNSARLEALGRERLNAVYQRDEWDAKVKQIDAESLTRFGHHMPIALGAAAEMLTRAIDGGDA